MWEPSNCIEAVYNELFNNTFFFLVSSYFTSRATTFALILFSFYKIRYAEGG